MRRFAGALFALTILFLAGCDSSKEAKAQETVVLKPVVEEATATPVVLTSAIDGRPVTVDSDWGAYVKRLDRGWKQKRHLYLKSTPLHKFIRAKYREMVEKYDLPVKELPWELTCMYAYAATEYPEKYGLDKDWMKGMWTHEGGWWTGAICKSIRKDGKLVLLPPDKWSYGCGQIEENTGGDHAKRRGFKTYDPMYLCYFPLANLDISCRIFKYKLKLWKTYPIALQAYNGGDSGWKDGRSKNYYRLIKGIVTRHWQEWGLTPQQS